MARFDEISHYSAKLQAIFGNPAGRVLRNKVECNIYHVKAVVTNSYELQGRPWQSVLFKLKILNRQK